MHSLPDEIQDLVHLLEQREQDHLNWINELEASVKKTRTFKLTTDPHKCAFGQWYDQYRSDNRIINMCLKKFDVPHRKIHAIAMQVKSLEEKKCFDEAFDIINQTRNNELTEIVTLFAQARKLLIEEQREIALVMEHGKNSIALAVDTIQAVEKISIEQMSDLPDIAVNPENQSIIAIGRRKNDDAFVQLLDTDILLADSIIPDSIIVPARLTDKDPVQDKG
jgi:purine-binding chemotaxis protein CheW